jgi:hypothetical protein
MTSILIKFVIRFERYDLDQVNHLHGPIFHRWLPDGENDAISVKTKSEDAKVSIWFERCGFVENGWIQFDHNKREVDSDILKRQAKLDAGPLRVKIELKEIKKEEAQALAEKQKGNINYISIGKRLTQIVNECVIPVIDILRLYYGQYWLQELHKWNSEKESLGNYFRHLYAKYSLDAGISWEDFIPDEPFVSIPFPVIIESDFSPYLSKEDWTALNVYSKKDFYSPLAVKLLSKAHELRDREDYKLAFIEGNTALEVAISDFFKNRLSLPDNLKLEMQSFWQLPIRAQLTVIASLIKDLSHEDISNAINSIQIRNKIVHEGWSPRKCKETTQALNSLFKVIARLASNKPMKFPSSSRTNTLFPVDEQRKDDRTS